MQLDQDAAGFLLSLAGRALIRHRPESPFLFVGRGEPMVAMHNGYFAIEECLTERTPLRHVAVLPAEFGWRLDCRATASGPPVVTITLSGGDQDAALDFNATDAGLWIVVSDPPACRGSRACLGRRQAVLIPEPARPATAALGIGAGRRARPQHLRDMAGRSGRRTGRRPVRAPTIRSRRSLSSRRYAVHLDTTAYAALDFRHPDFHELEAWAVPAALELHAAPDFAGLVSALSDRFGRTPELPAWTGHRGDHRPERRRCAASSGWTA